MVMRCQTFQCPFRGLPVMTLLGSVQTTSLLVVLIHAKAPIRKVPNRTKGLDAFRFAVVCIMRRWFGFSENLIGAVLIVFVP